MLDLSHQPPAVWLAVAAPAVVVVGLTGVAYLSGRAKAASSDKKRTRISRGDLFAATIGTAVAAEGMWETFKAFEMPVWLRVVTFAFIEINLVQCARRARASMEDHRGPGVDGIAMWVLTGISAALSVSHQLSTDHPNLAVVLVRLVAPPIAAWGWERQMRLERRRLQLGGGIAWRITPERILVWLRIAEATERTTAEVDAQRRVARVARMAHRVRLLKGTEAWAWRVRRAERALNRAVVAATAHARLATDPAQRSILIAQLSALYGAGDLAALSLAAPWAELTPRRPASDDLMDRLAQDRRDRAYGVRTEPRTAIRTSPVRESSQLPHGATPDADVIAISGDRTEPSRTTVQTRPYEGSAPRAASVHAAQAVHTEQVTAPVRPSVEKVVQELVVEIGDQDPDDWQPDYAALKSETGWSRSWLEKRVREARTAVRTTPNDTPYDRPYDNAQGDAS